MKDAYWKFPGTVFKIILQPIFLLPFASQKEMNLKYKHLFI